MQAQMDAAVASADEIMNHDDHSTLNIDHHTQSVITTHIEHQPPLDSSANNAQITSPNNVSPNLVLSNVTPITNSANVDYCNACVNKPNYKKCELCVKKYTAERVRQSRLRKKNNNKVRDPVPLEFIKCLECTDAKLSIRKMCKPCRLRYDVVRSTRRRFSEQSGVVTSAARGSPL